MRKAHYTNSTQSKPPKASKASAWHALNVESDHEDEDEVDDTQEIQIEEALKLYQTALKYHSEGPQSFLKTAEAYKELFKSEIFQYSESLSEYKRHEVFGDSLVFDSILEDDFEAGPTQSTGAADSAPNTLPQILHLSYKNHGQFLLESMQHGVAQHGGITSPESWSNIRGALNYFAEALDKEDTDLDLWLRAASVAAMLGSKRLTRYCLESIMDGNDELWESLLRLPGLEEGLAGQQLRELVGKLEDNVSLMQTPLSTMKRKKLSETLKTRLNPYPFAPLPADVAERDSRPSPQQEPDHVVLAPLKWDWSSVGEAILQQFIAEQRGIASRSVPGSCVRLHIPEDCETPHRIASESAPAPAVDESLEIQPSPPQIVEPSSPAADAGSAIKQDEAEESVQERNDQAVEAPTNVEVAPAPSRKRSTDSAGLPETTEGGRAKRIRTRNTATGQVGDTVVQDASTLLEGQLEHFAHADQCLHEIVIDIYARLGVKSLGKPEELRSLLLALPESTATDINDKAACDMYLALQSGNGKAAQVLLSSESFDLVGVTREAGLNAFLGYAKSGVGQASPKPILHDQDLRDLARSVNGSWLSTKEVAFTWVEALLSQIPSSAHRSSHNSPSSYLGFKWSEDLKRNVVQIIVNVDEHIFERMQKRVSKLDDQVLNAEFLSRKHALSRFDTSQIDMVQTLFELHLDIYSLIKHPHSQVDAATKMLQSDRLERWSNLAREAIQLRSACDPNLGMDDLSLRHIWASVFQMSVKDDVFPEHVLSAIAELKGIFSALGDRTIQVQNNAVMPQLSVAALDRELVRISMKDFFLKVFDHEEKDPVTVIESLEPILEQEEMVQSAEEHSAASASDANNPRDDASAAVSSQDATSETPSELESNQPSPIIEMRKFLDSANANVRLSLWQRLREAYDAIEYPPKVLSCYLRSIEAFVDDYETTSFQELSLAERQIKLLTRFRVIDEMVIKVLQIMRGEPSAFDCLAYEHVQSSMTAVAKLLHILSAANMFRDLIRIGKIAIPRFEGMPGQAFVSMSTKLDDIQLRLWTLQYYLLREGLAQNAEAFPMPSEDLFEFLRHVHHATGTRAFCHQSGRQFLRLAKDEILRLDDVIDANSRDTELCQVLHDLYGLKLFIEPAECQEFSSSPDVLDKKAAFTLLPFVMSQVAKVDMKDLHKTKQELRGSIEKVHAALGRPKQHDDVTFNRKAITTYFKSPIHPTELFSCLKGVGSIVTRAISKEEAVAASQGWFFLMGNIALSRFRSQKRMTQGPTEDLNYAQAFYLQDLEYTTERWETWYRIAQAYDTQLEEAVSWNADKMNSNTIELATLQRGAINCYAMAVACSVRDAVESSYAQAQVAQMYTEFGDRIYASSREPFAMEAFQTRDIERRFVNLPGLSGAQRDVPFVALQPYTAWKFASTLYKRAIRNNSGKWWNHYMLAKSLWKMWASNRAAALQSLASGMVLPERTPNWEDVVKPAIGAIERLPDKKGRSGEPILEPHYKLVSIVHKLVKGRAIDTSKGVEVLGSTFYSKNIGAPGNLEEWESYILAVIKALRTADKSSWHHRIIARSAHILHDDGKELLQAHAAKHELSQTIFTKTMAVQVWKPEYERPGRHFVYTLRYTRFFIDLLDTTGDKANFEALARRVRRKQTDFFQHTELWKDLCTRYLRLLRRSGNVSEGQEDSAFKSVNQEDFSTVAARVETWCQHPSTQHPVLDVLRDAIELKRLNNGLMKSTPIDDLIGDSYAMLFTTVGPTLPPLPSEQQQQPGPSGDVTHQPPVNPLSVASLMQGQVDGSAENHNTPFAMYHPSQLHSQHPPPMAQAPAVPEPAPKPRPKAVGKREIGRRAEACVQKAAVASTPQQSTSMPIRSPPVSNATIPSLFQRQSDEKPGQSLNLTPGIGLGGSALPAAVSFDSIPGTAAASVNNDHMLDTDHENDVDQDNDEHEGDGDGEGDTEHVALNDNDDDADDESELSELDESEVQEMGQAVQEHERRSASFATVKPLFPGLFAGRASADRAGSSVPFGSAVSAAPVPTQVVSAKAGSNNDTEDKMDVDGEKEDAKR